MADNIVKVGNAQGFWGDQIEAPAQLIAQQPDLDFLTMDYLAEVSMAVLAMQKAKMPSKGYAADFIESLKLLIPFWKEGRRFKVVVNAGGLNPIGCARETAEILSQANLLGMKIGVVSGDDVISLLKGNTDFPNMDTGVKIDEIRNDLISANAYFGAKPIVDALSLGADIVITGRVADPSLTVACCMHHFGWGWNSYDKIAGATVAGHLIECGTQATGGIATNWLEIPDPAHLGFPIAEISKDGSCVITKPTNTGGIVNEEIIKEQLLYEIGDPSNYISPDACVSFLSLQVKQQGNDRVSVEGAKGSPPPSSYKVSATFRDGYRAEGTLTLFGDNIEQKAKKCAAIIIQRVRDAGFELQRVYAEYLGCGYVVPGIVSNAGNPKECILRVAVQDKRKEAVACFARQFAPLVTSGPQGTTGYFSGRPKVKEAFGYWPCLVDRTLVKPHVEIIKSYATQF